MLFMDWRQISFIAPPVALVFLFVFLMWQARHKPLWARILVATIATPLALVSLGYAVLFTVVSTWNLDTKSEPICSPGGHLVARIETWEGFFSTDGGTNVRVYSLRGLRSGSAYSGSEYSLYTGGVRWIDDHTLEVRYDNSGDAESHTCENTQSVRVICLPSDTPSP